MLILALKETLLDASSVIESPKAVGEILSAESPPPAENLPTII